MSKMADQQREPLVAGHPAAVVPDAPADRDGGFSWLTLLGFAFLTFNSAMAIYRSDGDKYAIAFVGFSYIDLVLLFICLRLFEKAEPNSSARGNLKAAVWVLTTLLTVVFSYKVAAIMPVPVQVLVWAMAGATVLGGFYAFFVHRESKFPLMASRWREEMAIRKDNEPWQKFNADGPVLALVGPTLMENVKVHALLGKEMACFGLAYLRQGLQPITTAVIRRCSLRIAVHLAATTATAIATATTNNLRLRCTQQRRYRRKQPSPLAAMHSNSLNPWLTLSITSSSWQPPDSLISSYIPPNANKAVWFWGSAMREAGQALVQWGLVWIGY